MANFHPETITFEGHECKFLEKPLRCSRVRCTHGDYCRSCDACGITVKGYVYHCDEGNKEWDFHPRCTKLESEICIGDVIFRLQKHGQHSKCLWCNKRTVKGVSENIPGWSYVSNHKGYSFHVNCIIDMAKQHDTKNTNSSSTRDLTLSSLKKVDLALQVKKSSNGLNGRNKWFKVFQVFLKTILAILIGDPTTILASTLAHLVTEGLFHVG